MRRRPGHSGRHATSRTVRVALILATVAAAVTAAAVLASQPWQRRPVVQEALMAPTRHVAPPLPEGTPATVLAAGDIADCEGDGAATTAAVLQEHDGVVAAVGDLAYPDGSVEAFADCYAPTWGVVRQRTRPALGNHDVRTAGAAGYFDYFGQLAGPTPQGYYSYDLGDWHVVVLNSNCRVVGGCDPGSPQYEWLREDLAATDTGNILAYWHHPRYGSGIHGDTAAVDPFWDLLHEHGGDVVISGHAHSYQRSFPLDADGTATRSGQRQFVVGTGGANLRDLGDQHRDILEFAQSDHHGILRLDLEDCSYQWSFLPAGGGEPLDQGHTDGTC